MGERASRAAGAGKAGVIRILFDENEEKYIGSAYLDRRDLFGMHALGLASQRGNEDVIRMLVEYGASIDAPCGADEMTPLMHAIVAGKHMATSNLDTIQSLLEFGADPNLPRTKFAGYAAIHLAAIHNHHAIPLLGKWEGVNLHCRTHSGLDAISLAVTRGNHAAVEALIEAGCHLSMKMEEGEPTPEFAIAEGLLGFPTPLILSHALQKETSIRESLGFLANVNINETMLLECLKPPPKKRSKTSNWKT